VYDKVNEEQLAFKVGYALYNAPSEVDEQSKTAVYTKGQLNHIKQICDKIKSLQPSLDDSFYISCLYVVIRLRNKKNDVGIQVLFRVPKFVDGKPQLDCHNFIDPKPRLYESWDDYIRKNKLPKCDMCYPENGVYGVTDGIVNVMFGKSPACDTSTAVFTGLDISSTVMLVGATGVTLASLAVPIATPVIWGATATVLASGTYETARNCYRLHDIKKHGESLGLKNPDSRSAWLSLAGSFVGMASIGTTAIAKGVVSAESAISRMGIMTLRVLNVSSLAVSGIGVVNGIITLVMKRINGTLETVDILHFTSACLFFLNAVVTYNLANRLIEELAFSDLTNLFNLRENATYRMTKDIMEFNDSSTYNVLRQLVIGFKSVFYPNINIDDLESVVLSLVTLLANKAAGKINWITFSKETSQIMHKVWKKYENVIMQVLEEIRLTFDVPYWQMLMPKHTSTNLEMPRQMCEEVDRVTGICGISSHSHEHRNLMTFARAFSTAHGISSDQEFMDRFKFYCDCIIAQFREERENYENELDSQSDKVDFNREKFDESLGIQMNKNEFFFIKALDKVNHPDFLGNIDELYDNLPRIKNIDTQLPYLKTTKSCVYTFCGPLKQEKLKDDYYWEKVVDLTKFQVNQENSKLSRDGNLVVIEPKSSSSVQENNNLTDLEAVVIHSSFINDCQMGLLLIILK